MTERHEELIEAVEKLNERKNAMGLLQVTDRIDKGGRLEIGSLLSGFDINLHELEKVLQAILYATALHMESTDDIPNAITGAWVDGMATAFTLIGIREARAEEEAT